MHDYYGNPDRGAEDIQYGEDVVLKPSTTVITMLPNGNQSAHYEAPTALQMQGLVSLG